MSQAPGGPMIVAGSLNEPGTVTISGVPVTVDANNSFRGTVPTTTGTNTFAVVAKDATGNTTTQQYEVDLSGSSKSFSYDANGNLTSDGTRTFEWDARNQLLAVNVGTHQSEFTYDGKQRRVRVIEKESGVTQTDSRVLWCDEQICEERAVDGTTVTRRSFALGEQVTTTPRFFTTDHLGSIVEVTDSTNTLLARYAFDPWGRRTLSSGNDVTAIGFTGHRWQANAELWLALHRGYDVSLGRWIGQDPSGFSDGLNLYSYVNGDVIGSVDPLGLAKDRVGGKQSGCTEKDWGFCRTRCSLLGMGPPVGCYVCTWFKLTRSITVAGNTLNLRRRVRTVECNCEEPPSSKCEACETQPTWVAVLGSILLMCLSRGRAPAW